jgi:hypothetical protein
MKFRLSYLAFIPVLLISLAVNLYPASASDKAQTFSGEVSDAMCGAQHMMEGGKAECTRACVGKGSKYAFVVGAEVYTLDSSDKKVLDELDNLAGQKATINGTADGDTIKVSSVAPAK